MADHESKDPQGEHHNISGTIRIMILYLVAIVILWGSMFLTLMQRGG